MAPSYARAAVVGGEKNSAYAELSSRLGRNTLGLPGTLRIPAEGYLLNRPGGFLSKQAGRSFFLGTVLKYW